MGDGERHREFMELLDAHGAAVMGMLRRLCGSGHDAEDLFQETAARVWRGLPGMRGVLRNPRAWVMTIAYRALVNARSRRSEQWIESAGAEPVDTRVRSPEREVEQVETCDRMQAAVAELPAPVREVVVLHYMGGLSISQTAAAMDVSEGTVKSRLNAGLRKLRCMLEVPE